MVKFLLPGTATTNHPQLRYRCGNHIGPRIIALNTGREPIAYKFSSNLNFSTLMKNFVEFVQKPHCISNISFNHVC